MCKRMVKTWGYYVFLKKIYLKLNTSDNYKSSYNTLNSDKFWSKFDSTQFSDEQATGSKQSQPFEELLDYKNNFILICS